MAKRDSDAAAKRVVEYIRKDLEQEYIDRALIAIDDFRRDCPDMTISKAIYHLKRVRIHVYTDDTAYLHAVKLARLRLTEKQCQFT